MDKKLLEQYKKIYLEQRISEQDLQKSWEDISRILPAQDLPKHNSFSRYGFLFVCIFLLLLIGTVSMAQASRTGELLYPVKVLTNNVAVKIFGKPEITAEKVKKDRIDAPTKAPLPTEKGNKEEQKDSEQEGKKNKEQNTPKRNESKEETDKQENEVKGVRTDNQEYDNLPANEVKESKKSESEERGESNKNKTDGLNNGNANKEKNKNDNQVKAD